MKKILIAAALLSTCLTTPVYAKSGDGRTTSWWCAPSGMTLFTPILRTIMSDCSGSRPMER